MRATPRPSAATAIIVLTTGYSDDSGMLGGRVLDTAIGIGIGLLVNLIVWPPLRDRSAVAQIEALSERIGALLTDIGRELGQGCTDTAPDDWISATDDLDGDLDQAWVILQQARESGRMNPRPAVADRMRATEGLAFGARPALPGGRGNPQHGPYDRPGTRGHPTGGPGSSAGLSPTFWIERARPSRRPTRPPSARFATSSRRSPRSWRSMPCPTDSGRSPER